MAGVLLYDQDCAFCTRSVGLVARLRLAVGVCPLGSADLAGLGVDAGRAAREIPFVDGSGAVSYGHVAIAAALRTGALPLRIVAAVMTAPGLSLLFGALYRSVATHRHQLPGGSATCKI
jgi:predicted DCC family thiol-disulfide oxidoreductase YuxK